MMVVSIFIILFLVLYMEESVGFCLKGSVCRYARIHFISYILYIIRIWRLVLELTRPLSYVIFIIIIGRPILEWAPVFPVKLIFSSSMGFIVFISRLHLSNASNV